MGPLVSVVIPCHNSERFLRETLESVAAQTYAPLELVLIDDGSTDGTRRLIDSIAPHAKTLSTPNRGAAEARNIGMTLATGDYLQFLDADDLLAPDAIESRVAALRRTGAAVAYSDWQRLKEGPPGSFHAGDIVARAMEDVHPDPEVALFTSFWAPPAALLYSRAIAEKVGAWKQQFAPIEDARFLLDCAFAGAAFTHVPGTGALYRISDGPSHSRRDPRRFARSVLANAVDVESIWRSRPGGLRDVHRRALADCYGYVARDLFRTDPDGFADAVAHLARVGGLKATGWPRLASLMQRTIGHAASLRVLAWLRRPAP